MQIKQITSLEHPKVKHWVGLRLDADTRKASGEVLIVGEKMARELKVESLITVKDIAIRAEEKYLVTDEILKKITGLKAPDGVAAIVKMPKPLLHLNNHPILILDQISDPGNLGTLLRTALALNWKGVITTPGTVDLFNDKALRAGKGAQFHLPFIQMTPEEIEKLPVNFYLADIKGVSLEKAPLAAPLALILSNEGKGAQDWAKKISKKINIPMTPFVESLNVASSGAILLYAMRQK